MDVLMLSSGSPAIPDLRATEKLVQALSLAFHAEGLHAPNAIRQFLKLTPRASDLLLALPSGSNSLGELLQAASAAFVRESVVDDVLFDRLIDQAPGARERLEAIRAELLHPERLPPSWVSVGPEGGAIERIAVDPHEPDRLLCCAHIRLLGGAESDRIVMFRSLDRGGSWSALPEGGPSGLLVRWIEFDPHRPGRVLVATEDGLWETNQHGDRWRRILTNGESDRDDRVTWQVRFHPYHEDALLFVTGQEWGGGCSAGAATLSHAVKPDAGNSPVVCVEVGRKKGYFQFFDPEEGEWLSADLRPPRTAAAFAPKDWRRIWVAEERGLARSLNQGRSFELLGRPGKGHVWDIVLDPDDSERLWVGTDDGIYLSTNGGGDFCRVNDAANVRQVILDQAERPLLYAATACGPLMSQDRGETWQALGKGFPEKRCWSLALSRDGALYAGLDGAGVFRLDRGSDVWIPRNNGLLPVPIGRVATGRSGQVIVPSTVATYETEADRTGWQIVGPGALAVAVGGKGQIAAAGRTNDQLGVVRLTKNGGESWIGTETLPAPVFWVHVQESGVYARTSPQGTLFRLEPEMSWQEFGPKSDTESIRLADVLCTPEGSWLAIAFDGRLFYREGREGEWQSVAGPDSLGWEGTWRLFGEPQGELWAWRYEGGLCHRSTRTAEWQAIELPPGVEAVGGVCDDPRGRPGAFVAAKDGSLFWRSPEDPRWQRLADPWLVGRCGFLDAFGDPPCVLGSGTGGLYRLLLRD